MRRLRPLAELASTSTDTTALGALARAQTSRVLASAVRAAASSPSETVEGRPLRELVSDLAIVEFNRAKLGETSTDSAQQLVAIAEGLGGTPASGEMAALYALRAGDPSSGAAFFALADWRLKNASLTDSKQVIQRRKTLARLFDKMDGRATFGTSLPQVNIADIQARLADTRGKAPIVQSIAGMTRDNAKIVARSVIGF
jgi:hypothetical protein